MTTLAISKDEKLNASSGPTRRKSFQAKNIGLTAPKQPAKPELPKNFFQAALALVMTSVPLKPSRDFSKLKLTPRPSKMERAASPRSDAQNRPNYKREKEEIEAWDLSPELQEEALGFYDSLYGENIAWMPEEVALTWEYLHQDPIEVAKAYDDLGMDHVDTPLCWVARLYLCMPLPPEYFKIGDSRGVFYMHKIRLIKLPIHPGILYLKDLIRRVRKSLPVTETFELTSERQQVFYDKFDKESRVDMLLMRLAVEENTNKYQFYTNKLVTDTEELKAVNKGEAIDNQENTEPLNSKSKITDFMVFDVCSQLAIDRMVEPHLAGFVAAFMLEKEDTDKEWEWRSPLPQKFFWVNTVIKRAQTEYPFLEELASRLELHKEEMAKLFSRPQNFRDTLKLGFAFKNPSEAEVKKAVMKERCELMNRLIIKRTQNLKKVRTLRKADHLNSLVSPEEKSKSLQRSRKQSNADENESPDSPGLVSVMSKRRQNKQASNFATQLIKKKEEENKASQENAQEKETRALIKELHAILGEDIIVAALN